MKRLFAGLVAVAAASLIGCDNKGTPGGSGVTTSGDHGPRVGQAEDSFSLTVPTLSTHLKQGEAKAVSIGISRGKNFDGDVALKFDNLAKGVTIDPAAPVLKHGEAEVKVTVKAAEDAALGEFAVKVVGHPVKGADAVNELKLTVEKK